MLWPRSSASPLDLRVADVIVEINGRAVTGPGAFCDGVAAANWQPTVGVLRAGEPLTVPILAAQPVRGPMT